MEYKDAAAILNCNSGVFDIITPHGKELKRLFLSEQGNICEFAKRSKTKGFQLGRHIIEGWIALKKVESSKTDIVAKFKRYASRATFPSAFVRKCHEADPAKSCYENRITTGTRIDGEIISLKAIERYAPYAVQEFRKALKERRDYNSHRFDFRGYDGSLWLKVVEKDDGDYKAGDIVAGFSKEYRGCCNGYYYSLIDDEHFIGTDID